MVRYKNDPANTDYNAGDDFNYAVWTANTEITLCNVPWDSAYRDVWQPDTLTELNAFIDSRGDTTKISNAMYARIDEPISIDMPLGRAQRFNYVRVLNPSQPVPGNDTPKYYFYFILGVVHESPNTSKIVVQLDVWQTYIRLVKFGRAYIESGHIGIANKDNFRGYGRDFLSIPDGLDTGREYVTVASRSRSVMDSQGGFVVMAVSSTDLNGNHGTQDAPLNPSAKPDYVSGQIPSGAGFYFWEDAVDFMNFLIDFTDKPWVTGGIMSITLIPKPDILNYGGQWALEKDPVTKARRTYPEAKINTSLFSNWRNSPEILEYIPPRYRHLKKFLTSPYCLLQLTYNSGSAVVLKPESWNNPDARVIQMTSHILPSPRQAAVPVNYNGRNSFPSVPDGPVSDNLTSYFDGDHLDMAVFLSAFPTVPIVNNGQILALAATTRSTAAQYAASDWSQQRALQSNSVAYDQASAGINAGVDQANSAASTDMASVEIANRLASQQAMLGIFTGGVSGAGGGAMTGAVGGPAGMAAGAAGGALTGATAGVAGFIGQGMQANAASAQLANRLSSGATARDISSGLGSMMRDSNKGLSDWAARGDYASAQSALNARVQDTAVLGHGMSGQFGGESFNLATDNMRLTLRVKMVDQSSIAMIGEYWLRYGYPVRRSANIPNDLRVMSKFSYWKMSEVYIVSAAMPESHKQTLRGILEKGVTVWTEPLDIGVIDFADNVPLPDIVIEGYTPPPWEPEPDPIEPTPKKKRNKKMITYTTVDGVRKYALAGTSPGTPANFIVTESSVLGSSFLEACGVANAVSVSVSMFYELQAQYLAPVSTHEATVG